MSVLSNRPAGFGRCELMFAQRVAIEIDRYNTQDQKQDRKDFLAQLTAKDDPSRNHYRRDMTNHLSNNM